MNKTKTQKGITLIALIITIIVLLILAVVAINAVNNAGIIQYAQNSVDEYEKGQMKENTTLQNYMDILHYNKNNGETPEVKKITITPTTLELTVGGQTGKVTTTLPEGKTGTITYTSSNNNVAVVDASGVVTPVGKGTATITAACEGYTSVTCSVLVNEEDEDTLVEMYNDGRLNVGDIVEYVPTTVSTAYDLDKGLAAGTLTGVETTQYVSQETLEWRVLGYDEANNRILLISSSATTSGKIDLKGYRGYNNIESILRDTCQALYSKDEVAVGRSFTIDDMYKYLDLGVQQTTQATISSNAFIIDENGTLTLGGTTQNRTVTCNAFSGMISDLMISTDSTKLELISGKVIKDYIVGTQMREYKSSRIL